MAQPGVVLKQNSPILKRFEDAITKRGPGVRKALDTWTRIYGAFVRRRFAIYSRGGGDWPALALSTVRGRRDIAKKIAKVKVLTVKLAAHEAKSPGFSNKKLSAHLAKSERLQKQIVNAGANKNKQRSSLARNTRGKGELTSAGGTVSILQDTGLLFSHLAPEYIPITELQVDGTKFYATATFGDDTNYEGTGATVTDILSFHQRGGRHLPQRKILVPPDAKTINTMAKVMVRGVADDMAKG